MNSSTFMADKISCWLKSFPRAVVPIQNYFLTKVSEMSHSADKAIPYSNALPNIPIFIHWRSNSTY